MSDPYLSMGVSVAKSIKPTLLSSWHNVTLSDVAPTPHIVKPL